MEQDKYAYRKKYNMKGGYMNLYIDKLAVLYSAKQKAFQIEPFESTIQINLSHLKAGTSSTYEIIGLCDEYDDADQYIKEIEKTLK